MMVEMNVCRRYHQIMLLMANFDQPLRQSANMMIVDVGKAGDAGGFAILL